MEFPKESKEIFIVDEEIVEEFLNEENYYRSEIFFNYLSSWCCCKHAHMIPSLHKKIIDWIKKETIGKDTLTQTKVIAEFENWVEEADLLGEGDGDELHDTELLFDLLKLIYPNYPLRVVSSKYKNHPKLGSMDVDEIFQNIASNKEFMEFFERKYSIGKWDSSY